MHGDEGEWTGPDGTTYKGSFNKNSFHGLGILTNPKKDVYEYVFYFILKFYTLIFKFLGENL